MRFPLLFDHQIRIVEKIQVQEFSHQHREVLQTLRYAQGKLQLSEPTWSASFVGAGEEKAVFCLCDQNNRVFALEAIDERYYQNGRLADGAYFCNLAIEGLRNVPFREEALIGLRFTGLARIREYVYGYEWSRFQLDPHKQTSGDRIVTAWLQFCLAEQYAEYLRHYHDVHGRNILFEIREWTSKGVPVVLRDWSGHLRRAKIGTRPIDVR